MKTLEEAIRYYEEQATKCSNKVNEIILGPERCKQEKEEYTQLADWLRELQERRKQTEIIYCKDCKWWDTTWQNDFAPNYHYCPLIDGTHRGDFYCAKAERRT